jgi:hypothetical protein
MNTETGRKSLFDEIIKGIKERGDRGFKINDDIKYHIGSELEEEK